MCSTCHTCSSSEVTFSLFPSIHLSRLMCEFSLLSGPLLWLMCHDWPISYKAVGWWALPLYYLEEKVCIFLHLGTPSAYPAAQLKLRKDKTIKVLF